MEKIYKQFKAKKCHDGWWVVTEEEEIKIAKVPHFIKHPKAVAVALSSALQESKYALTDIV